MNHQDDIDMVKVRARMEARRNELGWSYRKVSTEAGLGEGYYHAVITNENKDPRIRELIKVSKALGLSLYYVLYGVKMSPRAEAFIRALEDNPDFSDDFARFLAPPGTS